MGKIIEYNTKGTCSKKILIELDGDVISDCKFVGGCPGNTTGVAALVKGMKVDEVVERLSGIKCGLKHTSCPDQLAKAVVQAIAE